MGRTGLIWRGEVYHVDLGQPVGHGPGFRRPAVVVSVDMPNNGPGGVVVVVPITTAGYYGLRSHDAGSLARWWFFLPGVVWGGSLLVRVPEKSVCRSATLAVIAV